MPDKLFTSGPLGDHKRCPICNEWGFSGRHYCSPTFWVKLEDEDDDEKEAIRAEDAEAAACKYISRHFSDFEYPDTSTVLVTDPRDNKVFKFTVEAEQTTSFSATLEDTAQAEPEEAEAEE